jgi:hypothetical protein
LGIERAPDDERDAHGGEKSIADNVEERLLPVLGRSWDSLEEEEVAPAALVKGEEGKAVRLDAGDGLDARFDLLLKADRTDLIGGSMRETGGAGIKREDKHVVLVEAGVDAGQVNEAAKK